MVLYLIQTFTGLLIGLVYSWVFDTGLPGVVYVWWETYNGSFLIRLHSEFGNLVFFFLYIHILIKIWNSSYQAEVDHTWLSGIIILTGADKKIEAYLLEKLPIAWVSLITKY